MKKKIIVATLFIATTISAYFVGTTQAETETVTETIKVIPDGYINTNSEEFQNDYINMNDVVDFKTTDSGLMLYTNDGNGYYWER